MDKKKKEAYAKFLARRLILNFRKEFKEKIGVYPKFNIIYNPMYNISLRKLDKCISSLFTDPRLTIKRYEGTTMSDENSAWRFIFMYFAKKSNFSLKQIAKYMMYKDHSSIIHGLKKADQYLQTSVEFQEKFNQAKYAVESSIFELSADKEDHSQSILDSLVAA